MSFGEPRTLLILGQPLRIRPSEGSLCSWIMFCMPRTVDDAGPLYQDCFAQTPRLMLYLIWLLGSRVSVIMDGHVDKSCLCNQPVTKASDPWTRVSFLGKDFTYPSSLLLEECILCGPRRGKTWKPKSDFSGLHPMHIFVLLLLVCCNKALAVRIAC